MVHVDCILTIFWSLAAAPFHLPKSRQSTVRNILLVLTIFHVRIFCPLYWIYWSQLIFLMLALKCPAVTECIDALWEQPACFYEPVSLKTTRDGPALQVSGQRCLSANFSFMLSMTHRRVHVFTWEVCLTYVLLSFASWFFKIFYNVARVSNSCKLYVFFLHSFFAFKFWTYIKELDLFVRLGQWLEQWSLKG